jgi:hypothetical protein
MDARARRGDGDNGGDDGDGDRGDDVGCVERVHGGADRGGAQRGGGHVVGFYLDAGREVLAKRLDEHGVVR